MFVNLFHSEIQLKIDSLPDSFLPGKSKRQIDPIKSHPVDILFPIFPLPPRRGITQGAHILIISKSVQCTWIGVKLSKGRHFFAKFLTYRYLSLELIFTRASGKVSGSWTWFPSHET